MPHDNHTPCRFSTEPFKLPRSVYERYVATRWLRSRGWWLVGMPIALAVGVAVATADLRWVLVALIYVFIIAPGIISMAYFRYLLTPQARLTALLKSLTVTPGESITVHYEPTDDTELTLPPDETIPWSDVTAIRPVAGNIAIELRPAPHPRFIILPRKAVAEGEQQKFLALLTPQQPEAHKK